MISEKLSQFIREKRIDSAAKLRVILFLGENNSLINGPQQLAERVFFEVPLVEKIITELHAAGVLIRNSEGFILHDEPILQECLTALITAFQCPVERQELLDHIKATAPAFV